MDLYYVDITLSGTVYRGHLFIKCVQIYTQAFTNVKCIDASFLFCSSSEYRFILLFLYYSVLPVSIDVVLNLSPGKHEFN